MVSRERLLRGPKRQTQPGSPPSLTAASASPAIADHNARQCDPEPQANAKPSPSTPHPIATDTEDGATPPKQNSKIIANVKAIAMPNGPSMQPSALEPKTSTKRPIRSALKKTSAQAIQMEAVCRALFDIVMDRSAPASARAAAARTLLDELNRRGNPSDKPLSALSIDELQAELDAGGKAG